MPRFFFHFVRKGRQVPDPDGVELGDLLAAHRYAAGLAEKTARLTADLPDRSGWAIEVTDGEQRPVLTVLIAVDHDFQTKPLKAG